MKKFLIVVLVFLLSSITVSANENNYVLKAQISKVNCVPKQFFGTWSVQSTRIETNSEKSFAQTSLDMWNLRRSGNVIELRNPVTSAIAEIYIEDVTDNEIIFSHFDKEGNTLVKDTVVLKLGETTFSGSNELQLETTKIDEYGRKSVEVKYARYKIKGSKLSGTGSF